VVTSASRQCVSARTATRCAYLQVRLRVRGALNGKARHYYNPLPGDMPYQAAAGVARGAWASRLRTGQYGNQYGNQYGSRALLVACAGRHVGYGYSSHPGGMLGPQLLRLDAPAHRRHE
jgi:hypothetical protein